MAAGKKSFVLYTSYIHAIELLTNEQSGKLLKLIFNYVNDLDPVEEDIVVRLAFEPIKQQLKRDLKEWRTERKRRSDAGKKGMESRWHKNITKDNTTITDDKSVIKPITEITDNVNVNVNVNENVDVNVERENTSLPANLENSNLYRKPNIPTKQQVFEAIVKSGGNVEMAKSFYEKHEGTGWYLNGSPIVNYTSLASRFVTNWKDNEQKGKPKTDDNYNPNGHLKKLND